MTRKKYDKTFKKEAVKLALESEKSTAQVARELGLKDSLLYSWISQAKEEDDNSGDTGQSKADLIKELLETKKELARVKEKREILKKAAKFFANEQK